MLPAGDYVPNDVSGSNIELLARKKIKSDETGDPETEVETLFVNCDHSHSYQMDASVLAVVIGTIVCLIGIINRIVCRYHIILDANQS